MLKKLISIALVLTLVLSLFTVVVSATGTESYEVIYSRDFDREPTQAAPTNNLRFLDSRIAANNLGNWTYNYSSKYLQCLTIDGSNVMMETTNDPSSNVYRFAEDVTSGVFYLSMDIGFHDQGANWDDAYIMLYSADYTNDNITGGGWNAMMENTGKRYALYLRGYTADGSTPARMVVRAGNPYDGLTSIDWEGAEKKLTAEKLHRFDLVYNLDTDYAWIYLDGELMEYRAVEDAYRDNINKITAIGLRMKKDMFVDNIRIAKGPANSFDYAVKNITSTGFDVEFNQSVFNLTTSNISVNGAAATAVTPKNANVYTVTAAMTSEPTITLSDVANVSGEKINDTKTYNKLANINFDGPEMNIESISGTSGSTYADGTFRVTGGVERFALRNNNSQYNDSPGILRIVAKAHSAWHDSFFHLDFNNYAYAMGKLTIAYDMCFYNPQNFETWLVCEDSPTDNTGGLALPSFLNGNTYGYNGTTVQPLKSTDSFKDSWHNIKHVLDFDKNTLTSYIDGVVFYNGEIANNTYFDDKTKIKGLRFCQGAVQSTTQSLYMDNLDIHTEYVPNASGIYVTNAKATGTVADGNTLTYTAKIFNTTDSAIQPYLLTGLYNGSKLIKATYAQSEEIAAGASGNVSFDSEACDVNTTAVKGFIWESLTNLKPLCPTL